MFFIKKEIVSTHSQLFKTLVQILEGNYDTVLILEVKYSLPLFSAFKPFLISPVPFSDPSSPRL